MLKWRLLTAFCLIPCVLWVVWLAPPVVLPLFFAAIVLLAAWEWTQLMSLGGQMARLGYTLVILAVLISSWPWLTGGGDALPVLIVAALWWLAALAWLVVFVRRPALGTPAPLLLGLIGVVVLGSFWIALVSIQHDGAFGPYWVTMLLLLVWGSDAGGYFVGRAWGRRKLAPRISPGKTQEGALGSVLVGLLAGGGYYACGRLFDFAPAGIDPLVLLGFALATIVVAIVGDLFESMLKRQRNIKDSGWLLPGHGGVLDRIDALLAATPILALGLRGVS